MTTIEGTRGTQIDVGERYKLVIKIFCTKAYKTYQHVTTPYGNSFLLPNIRPHLPLQPKLVPQPFVVIMDAWVLQYTIREILGSLEICFRQIGEPLPMLLLHALLFENSVPREKKRKTLTNTLEKLYSMEAQQTTDNECAMEI